MTDIEERLRDAFRAVDEHVVVPPRREDVRSVRPVGRWLAAAAVLVVAVTASAIFVATHDSNRRVGVSADDVPVTAAEFNANASAVCATIIRDRSGVAPRFATLDAYRVVADRRGELIARAIHDVAALAPPADEEGLPATVIRTLRVADNGVDVVEHYVEAGDLDGATTAWPDIDALIDDALTILFNHGAAGCQP
jgi:hypothetical protein